MNSGRLLFTMALLVPTYVYASQCAIEIEPISCEKRSGIFFKSLGEELVQWDRASPYSVQHGEQVAVAICNYRNERVDIATLSEQSLIPTIISSIGKNASVRVDIENSANVTANQRLVIGEELPEGVPNNSSDPLPSTPEPDIATPALIADIVHGDIQEGAQIQVNVESSANVYLLQEHSELHIGKASLLEEIINKPRDGQHSHIHFGCLQLHLEDSANVYGTPSSYVYIRDGQLEDENIDYTFDISSILIEKNNVANVQAKELHIFDGELSDEGVDTQSYSHSSIEVMFENVGNAQVEHLRIIDGELVDEIIDTSEVSDSSVSITLENVANAWGSSLHIHEGELLDEVLDATHIAHSQISIALEEVGSSHTSDSVYILQGELIDEIMDIGHLHQAQVSIDVENSANSSGFNTHIYYGELLDETLDVGDISHSRISIELDSTGNVFNGGHTHIEWGELVDEVVDVEYSVMNSRVDIELSQTANNDANQIHIIYGELLDETFDVQVVENATIEISLADTGNAIEADQLEVTQGELVDEVFDHYSMSESSVFIELDGVANVASSNDKASNIALSHAELLDEVVDTEWSLENSSGMVRVKNSANAFSESLSLDKGALINRYLDVPVGSAVHLYTTSSGLWVK